MDSSSRVNRFTSRTGASVKDAKDFLSSFSGELEAAINAYNLLNNVAEAGPQKNQQMQQQQQQQQQQLSASGSPPLSPQAMQRKYLKRGLSKTTENIRLVNQLREQQADTIIEAEEDECVETPDYTFILPDLTVYPEDFRAFLHKELIETSTLVSLESAGRLNWWSDLSVCQRLLPLATTGDGNCLLHAASLGMWGFHDRLLTLRKTLFAALTNRGNKASFWRRWRWHQTQSNKQSGLILNEDEWDAEWKALLKLASTKPRTAPGEPATETRPPAEPVNGSEEEVFYESLEEFHVFVLAHILRRPIIVVADTILKDSNGEALAPIPFGGIYLPLLLHHSNCHTSPLLLTYDAAHFSALVAMDMDMHTPPSAGSNSSNNGGGGASIHSAIPLVDPNWELLPLHFFVDPGEKYDWRTDQPQCQPPSLDAQLSVLSQYLDVLSLPLPSSMAPSPPVTPVTEQVVNGTNGGNGGGNGIQRSVSNESDDGKGDKDKKKNKQLQGVAKSFGSFGKSLGKNFKKMGTLGKDKDKEKDKKKGKNSSTPPLPLTVANNGLSAEALSDRQHVLCARLLYKRMAYQDKIVRNYLQSAEDRFRSEQAIQKIQDEERPPRNAPNNSKPVECINQGCKGKGTADTSYLCKTCFEKQKVVESNRDRSDGEQYSRGGGGDDSDGMVASLGLSPLHINSVAAAGVNSSPAFTRHDTLITTGKSKFYTLPAEEHAATQVYPPPPQHQPPAPNNKLRFVSPPLDPIYSSSSTSALPSTVELSRSSFYDSSLSREGIVSNHMSSHVLPSQSHPAPQNPPPRYVNNLKAGSSTVPRKGGMVAQEIQPSQALAATFMGDKQYSDLTPNNNVNLLRNADQQQFKATNKTLDFADTHCKLNVNLDPGSSRTLPTGRSATRNCQTPNCEFFGTLDTDYLCSACYKKKHKQLLKQAEMQHGKHTNL